MPLKSPYLALLFKRYTMREQSYTEDDISCIEKASVPFGPVFIIVPVMEGHRERGATLFSSVCDAAFRTHGEKQTQGFIGMGSLDRICDSRFWVFVRENKLPCFRFTLFPVC